MSVLSIDNSKFNRINYQFIAKLLNNILVSRNEQRCKIFDFCYTKMTFEWFYILINSFPLLPSINMNMNNSIQS